MYIFMENITEPSMLKKDNTYKQTYNQQDLCYQKKMKQ